MVYTYEEFADMHYFYGMARGSGLEARRLYREHYPNRRIPSHTIFERIHRRLRETGQLAPTRNEAGGPAVPPQNVNLEEAVIQRLIAEPDISTRQLAMEFDVTRMTIWRIIKNAGYYPYHLQRVQALYPGDKIHRLNFCRWVLNQPQMGNENFAMNILFTDESEFTRNGINNFHNRHLWDIENPHGIIGAGHQRRFSLNVWGGIIGNFLIGPVFLPARLNGAAYHRFLAFQLAQLLENVPIPTRQRMWFMHDGAPAHFSLIARNWLNQPNHYANRWIGRGGPVEWPARSPDLNPCDSYLWGHLDALVYTTPINDVEDLRQRIIHAFQTIRNTDGILRRVNTSFYRRLEACIQSDGGHFEQFL